MNEYPWQEFESRIARRDFRGMTKDVLPTPAMLVDLDILERNLQTMADYTKSVGIDLRPHAKVHKSVDIARRQVGLGAIGITTATIAESELMSNAGISNVLWSKQPVSRNNIARAIALAKRDATFLFTVDDPQVVDWVEQAAEAADAHCRVIVALYAGIARQGIEGGAAALELAWRVESSKRLRFEGFMAYSATASHTKGWQERKRISADDLTGLQETLYLAKRAGFQVKIVTGGSTGTYNIDKDYGLTELQCGSYVFMDTSYFPLGTKESDGIYSDFGGSLTVLTTIDSKRHPGRAAIDYGNKAMAKPTDQVKGKPWLSIANQGAEYGALLWKEGEVTDREPQLGDRLEIYCSNLDMSTNCYDRYYVVRGNDVVDVWPIMGRSGAAQR